jgi:hypothetical protein
VAAFEQDVQVPSQEFWQQKPSRQNPVRHWGSRAQAAPVASLQSSSPLSLAQPGGHTASAGPQFRWQVPLPLQAPRSWSQRAVAGLLPVTMQRPPLAQSVRPSLHSFGGWQSVETQFGAQVPPLQTPAWPPTVQAMPLAFSQAVPFEVHRWHWPQATQHSLKPTQRPPPQLLPVWTQPPFWQVPQAGQLPAWPFVQQVALSTQAVPQTLSPPGQASLQTCVRGMQALSHRWVLGSQVKLHVDPLQLGVAFAGVGQRSHSSPQESTLRLSRQTSPGQA